MKIHLTPRVERQLRDLPPPAARRVLSALRALEAAPRSGLAYPPETAFRDLFYKNVVVQPRRWSYRITYEVRDDGIWILLLHPPWRVVTRADLTPPDDE